MPQGDEDKANVKMAVMVKIAIALQLFSQSAQNHYEYLCTMPLRICWHM